MITPPIMRALMPHEVVWHNSSSPLSAAYWMSKTLAKFVPM